MTIRPLFRRCCYFFIITFTMHLIRTLASYSGNGGVLLSSCPVFCVCWLLNSSRIDGGIGMKCNGEPYKRLNVSTFGRFPMKQRLEEMDLSRNGITELPPAVFRGFTFLRSLNLSGNNLKQLQADWLDGIGYLEKLYLADNPIRFLPDSSFERLTSLKYIDLATPYLTCDCHMKWFHRFIGGRRKSKKTRAPVKRVKVELSAGTRCNFPARLRGTHFADLSRKHLTCSGQLDPSIFDLHPESSRALTPGSSISLICKVSTMKDDETLEWLHNGKPYRTGAYQLETAFVDDGAFHLTTVRMTRVQMEDGGEWTCRLETAKGSLQKSVHIFILGNLTEMMCRAEATVDWKGRFVWPDALPMSTVDLECPDGNGDNASRVCGEDGHWRDPLTDQCSYRSTASSQLIMMQREREKRKEVKEFLEELKNITNEMSVESSTAEDVNLALNLIEQVAPLANGREQLMHDIINDLLNVRSTILNTAELRYRTGRRLLNIIRSSSTSLSYSEFAVEDCSVTRNDAMGLTVAYSANLGVENSGGLKCWRRTLQDEMRDISQASSTLELILNFGLDLEALELQIPLRFMWFRKGDSLTRRVGAWNVSTWAIEHSAIGMVSNRFADITDFLKNDSTGYLILKWTVVPKRGKSLDGNRIAVLTENVQGPMEWMPVEDCECLTASSRSISFSCPLMLGWFTLIRETNGDDSVGIDQFCCESLTPWAMAATGLTVSCLLTAFFVHCFCRKRVEWSVKLCHALVNLWLALTVLLLTFSLGIDRVEEETLCMVVTVALHYLTLAALLWMFLVVRTIQRKLRKSIYPPTVDDDDEDELGTFSDGRPKPRHGPLVGMYFLAWGLPAMPCAFTLPLRFETYTLRKEICFVDTSMVTLVALAVPALVLILVTFILLLKGYRYQTELEHGRNKTVCTTLSNGSVHTQNGAVNQTDSISCASTAICGNEKDGARRHLTAASTVFALTLISYGIAAAMLTRAWILVGLAQFEYYFTLTLSGLYATTVGLMGLAVVWFYVLGQSALMERRRKQEKEKKTEVTKTVTGAGADAVRRRPRPSRQLQTTTISDDKQDSTVASLPADSTVDGRGRCRRTANAGTTVTRPPSEISGTVAPSGTNVSTSRSYRAQQAIARKYYEKQRAKKNSMRADEDEEGSKENADGETDRRCSDGQMEQMPMVSDQQDTIGQPRDHAGDPANVGDEQTDETAVLVSDTTQPAVDAGKRTKRRPSVELYRKPSRVSGYHSDAAPLGRACSGRQSGSDEDSAPEALRSMDGTRARVQVSSDIAGDVNVGDKEETSV